MAHKLRRLSESILDKPQLIYAPKFKEIAEYLEKRSAADDDWWDDQDEPALESEDAASDELPYEVIRLHGPTTYRTSGWEALCGGASYQSILSQMQAICNDGKKKTVLLDVDSGGGEAYRCFETGVELRNMADQNGVRLIAYVDGIAASAAYALTSVCHEVIANPDAEAGSIGVVVRLVNNSKQLQDAGIDVSYITAGADKVPFKADGQFKESFLEDLQSKIDVLYTEFVSHVSKYRSMDPDAVRNTQARMFTAADAKDLGLVDQLMTGSEFQTYLNNIAGNQPEPEAKPVREGDGFTVVDASLTKPTENLLNMADKTPEVQDVDSILAKLASANAAQEEMAAKLAAYEKREADRELAAHKDAIKAEFAESGIEFSHLDEIVAKAAEDESVKTLMAGMIGDFGAKLKASTDSFNAKLAEQKEAFEAEKAELAAAKAEAEEQAANAKAEFAKPEGLGGDNHSEQDYQDEADQQEKALSAFNDFCKENVEGFGTNL